MWTGGFPRIQCRVDTLAFNTKISQHISSQMPSTKMIVIACTASGCIQVESLAINLVQYHQKQIHELMLLPDNARIQVA